MLTFPYKCYHFHDISDSGIVMICYFVHFLIWAEKWMYPSGIKILSCDMSNEKTTYTGVCTSIGLPMHFTMVWNSHLWVTDTGTLLLILLTSNSDHHLPENTCYFAYSWVCVLKSGYSSSEMLCIVIFSRISWA